MARAGRAPSRVNLGRRIKVFRIGVRRPASGNGWPTKCIGHPGVKNKWSTPFVPFRLVVGGEVEPLCKEGRPEAFYAILVDQVETTIGLDGIPRSGSVKRTLKSFESAILVEWLYNPRDPLRLGSCTPSAHGYVEIQHGFGGRHISRHSEKVRAADMPPLRSAEGVWDRELTRPSISPVTSEVIKPLRPDDRVGGRTFRESSLQSLADLFHSSAQVAIPPP